MDEKIIKKNAVPVIAAMITALAFSFTGLPMDGNTSVEKMSDVYNGLGCTSLLAWILLLILYVKGWEGYRKYRNWQAHVLAVIFSAGMLLGTSYFTNGNWDFLFGAKKQILISAGCFILSVIWESLIFGGFLRWSFSERPVGVSRPERKK